MFTLPTIMVAPNGAHKTQADHPALPMTIPEIVACADACYAAGAQGIHAHVRDAQGQHVLDVGLYRELLQQLAQTVPHLRVQVTSEAAGRYQAFEQQAVIRELKPAYVSVALREMLPNGADKAQTLQAKAFYHWAAEHAVMLQHILYSAEDLEDWFQQCEQGIIPVQPQAHLLFVLGRYHNNLQSQPQDLQPFLDTFAHYQGQQTTTPHLASEAIEWAACAFGQQEIDCLLFALQQGGKARIGFENNLFNREGSLAHSNQERVAELVSLSMK